MTVERKVTIVDKILTTEDGTPIATESNNVVTLDNSQTVEVDTFYIKNQEEITPHIKKENNHE